MSDHKIIAISSSEGDHMLLHIATLTELPTATVESISVLSYIVFSYNVMHYS